MDTEVLQFTVNAPPTLRHVVPCGSVGNQPLSSQEHLIAPLCPKSFLTLKIRAANGDSCVTSDSLISLILTDLCWRLGYLRNLSSVVLGLFLEPCDSQPWEEFKTFLKKSCIPVNIYYRL